MERMSVSDLNIYRAELVEDMLKSLREMAQMQANTLSIINEVIADFQQK